MAELGRLIRSRVWSRNTLLTTMFVAMAASGALGLDSGAMPDADTAPAFDVVSVKPIDSGGRMTMIGMRYTPDGIQASLTMSILARAAYGGLMAMPSDDRAIGLPDWATSQYFEVNAKMSEAQVADFAKLSKADQDQRRQQMLQALLADRFKMKAHRESRQMPDYELVVAKGGSKLKESDASNASAAKGADGKPITGSFLRMSGGKIQAQSYTMQQLANFLAQLTTWVGRPVVDKTGLTGKYSFTLDWLPEGGVKVGPGATAEPDESGLSIFTALQEQLGLKLQPGTGMFDVVVVDHVERPSAN